MSDIPTTSGIYCIRNLITGKQYIGSAVNLRDRRRQHFELLKRGCHTNKYLQHSVDKHGLSAFHFVIIELVDDKNLLIQREQFLLDKNEKGYNICPTAGSRFGMKATKETREKMSATRKGEQNSFYGRKHTTETKAKISKANSGRLSGKKLSNEHKAKIAASLRGHPGLYGEENPFYGKKHTAETITKMSNARKQCWKQYYAERDELQLLLF